MARRSNPVVVLVSLAITVTMVLLVLWQWADVHTTVAAEPVVEALADASMQLGTPVLSVRRTPGVLSRAANARALRNQLVPLASRIGPSSCGSVAVDGLTVSTVNEDLPVLPASTLKLVVAAVAVDVLGPDHRFTTTAHADVAANGTIGGDLVLVGGGDPVLTTAAWLQDSGQTYPPINVTSLEALADAVVAAGVARIAGRVVGNGGRYDDERFIPSWSEAIRVTEAGPYGALMVNDARLPNAAVASDPALGAAEVFTRLLLERGVEIAEEPAADSAAPTGVEIAAVESAPLSAIVAEMLVTSDDNTAELLVKEIGLSAGGEGSTAAGLTEVERRLQGWGIPSDGVVLVDGSGLSRDNRVTCRALMGVLQHGSIEDPVGQGLPVAAQSGTLVAEFEETPMAGVLRGKTGSLTDVKGLVGYVPSPDGAVIEFALVLNENAIQQDAFRDVWERLLAEALASYPSGPRADQLAPR
ncbi:MAG: putative D-alanyl-D-alanine carboxypeptidase [Actinomycetota bacterium]|jgi:D-alanyl-D-alanine carboxypeptidase/D-alanyl-D-alanine-endopeptidase (penicillin-binding protein 4)